MHAMQVTLESLLNLDSGASYEGKVMSITDATMECSDILQEISIIEQNLTTYEAAKIIKKAKSAKKKVKATKTKMKAKDAKAKKAGGKVVKITKAKKAALEGDEDVDGGTGPLPTTDDTNGLTDTDLDADPNAEVEVTEVVEDGTPEDEIVGTEGTDFIIMYEDASIIALEAEEVKQKGAFFAKIKAFLKKIGDWIKSAVAKVIEFFNFDKKYYDKNAAAIAKGLKTDTAVTIFKCPRSPSTISSEMYSDAEKIVKAANDMMKQLKDARASKETISAKQAAGAKAGEDYGNAITTMEILGISLGDADKVKKIKAAIVADKSEEVALNQSGWSAADIKSIIVDSQKQWKDLKASVDMFTKITMMIIDNVVKNVDNAARAIDPELTGAPTQVYKCLGLCFSGYGKLRGQASKVMHAAGKAGGGEAAPAGGPSEAAEPANSDAAQ